MRWKDDIQLSILACENQKTKAELTEEEFLSKFRKEDKLYPVISLVFYYGLTPWDASVDLYGMFMQNNLFEKSELLKKYVSNYRLNLIDAGNIENIQKFH